MIDGYLYCFSNPSMPGIVKVGVTERTPESRLSEANASDTWKPPTPYKIEFAKRIKNPTEKEKTLHNLLEKYTERIHSRREFFRVSTEEVRMFFNLVDGEMWVENGFPTLVPNDRNNPEFIATTVTDPLPPLEGYMVEHMNGPTSIEQGILLPFTVIQFRTALEERFTIDLTDTSACVPCRDIITHLKTMNMNLSDTKIGRELSKLGLTKSDKKINGKSVRVWNGIKE